MPRLFRKTRESIIELCERCGSACDSACRAARLVERTRLRVLEAGGRL